MRSIPLLLASVLVMAFCLSAPASAAPRSPPVPLLWKLSDADNTVYLLGSFHLLREGDYPLSPLVDAAFDDAESVVFEVPPRELADPSNGALAARLARYADGRSLTASVPATTRAQLQAMLAARGASLAQYDAFEPWFVNLALVMGLSDTMGFRADLGLDQALIRRAAAAGKPASGLETMASQLRALDATPEAEQISALAELAESPERMRAMLDDLHHAWRTGDAGRLDELTRAEMARETPETYRLLNVERNRAWVPQIVRMLDRPGTDDVLVVVGAMHLLGKDGLVERLRAAGYRVERVRAVQPAEHRVSKRPGAGSTVLRRGTTPR